MPAILFEDKNNLLINEKAMLEEEYSTHLKTEFSTGQSIYIIYIFKVGIT